MSARRQGDLFFFLSLSLSAFLMGHSLVVQVDFEACFGNLAESVNGHRPHRRVPEMSFGELAYAAGQATSVVQVIIAVLGLLPLSPFWIAWRVSRDGPFGHLWIVSAMVALIAIVCWTFTMDLGEFHDCDLKGVDLGILFAPILYTAVILAPTLALALLRSLFLSDTGGE
ncbi:MAG TPA: hypothetical protein VF688_09325 [Allosphingosinicella sp.]|jgi:hypothetical protein